MRINYTKPISQIPKFTECCLKGIYFFDIIPDKRKADPEFNHHQVDTEHRNISVYCVLCQFCWLELSGVFERRENPSLPHSHPHPYTCGVLRKWLALFFRVLGYVRKRHSQQAPLHEFMLIHRRRQFEQVDELYNYQICRSLSHSAIVDVGNAKVLGIRHILSVFLAVSAENLEWIQALMEIMEGVWFGEPEFFRLKSTHPERLRNRN